MGGDRAGAVRARLAGAAAVRRAGDGGVVRVCRRDGRRRPPGLGARPARRRRRSAATGSPRWSRRAPSVGRLGPGLGARRRACRSSPAAATRSWPRPGSAGLADGVVTVVAGSSTPVQVGGGAAARPARARSGWMSTHARADLWAVEGNAGYPGTFQGWWRGSPPRTTGPRARASCSRSPACPAWTEQAWRPPRAGVAASGCSPTPPPATSRGPCSRRTRTPSAATSRSSSGRSAGRPRRRRGVRRRGRATGGSRGCWRRCSGGTCTWPTAASAAALAGAALVTGQALPGLPDRVVPAGDPDAVRGRLPPVARRRGAAPAALRSG